MNVTVENLAPCKKLVRIELDAPAVDAAFADMTKEYVPGVLGAPGRSREALVVLAPPSARVVPQSAITAC